jgi:hypothetical protein
MTSGKKKNEDLGLPTSCPSWCLNGLKGHRQALSEGNTLQEANVHMSDDLGGLVNEIRNYIASRVDRAGQGGWNVRLVEEELMSAVRLAVHVGEPAPGTAAGWRFREETLDLTTSEARTLATQLTFLADQDELHRYDGV